MKRVLKQNKTILNHISAVPFWKRWMRITIRRYLWRLEELFINDSGEKEVIFPLAEQSKTVAASSELQYRVDGNFQ